MFEREREDLIAEIVVLRYRLRLKKRLPVVLEGSNIDEDLRTQPLEVLLHSRSRLKRVLARY